MPPRILVVEDNATNLELLLYLLRAFGYEPAVATGGEEGLAVARRERPDLVLLDIQMPEVDGFEVLRRMREDTGLRGVPVLAVTALAMTGDRERVLSAGFDGYLSKPIEPEAFLAQLAKFLGESKAAAPVRGPDPPAPEPCGDPGPGRNRSILALDDFAVNLQLVRDILEPLGFRVSTASGVEEAMVMARADPPDLALSDIHLGKESGFDFALALQADPRLATVPLLFLTSTSYEERHRGRARALGAAGFLVRPLEPEALVAAILEGLDGPRGRR